MISSPLPRGVGDDKELDVRLPGDRAISIHRPGGGHPSCDAAPAATDRAVIVVSQMIR